MSIEKVMAALAAHPEIELAFVYGSVARGLARRDSDVGVAVQAPAPLDATDKMRLIEDIASATGRTVDLVDLRIVGEPLLGQILKRRTRRPHLADAAACLRHGRFHALCGAHAGGTEKGMDRLIAERKLDSPRQSPLLANDADLQDAVMLNPRRPCRRPFMQPSLPAFL